MYARDTVEFNRQAEDCIWRALKQKNEAVNAMSFELI